EAIRGVISLGNRDIAGAGSVRCRRRLLSGGGFFGGSSFFGSFLGGSRFFRRGRFLGRSLAGRLFRRCGIFNRCRFFGRKGQFGRRLFGDRRNVIGQRVVDRRAAFHGRAFARNRFRSVRVLVAPGRKQTQCTNRQECRQFLHRRCSVEKWLRCTHWWP